MPRHVEEYAVRLPGDYADSAKPHGRAEIFAGFWFASKAEGGEEERPLHMHDVAEAGVRRVIEVEAAVAEAQCRPGLPGIVDGADDLPIRMRADAEAADIAIGRQPEHIAEIVVIAGRDQRIGPLGRAQDTRRREDPAVQRYVGGESPGAETDAGIERLTRL